MRHSVLTLNKKEITDFAKERNELLKKSKSEWVLFLDKDEKISNFQFPISNKFSSYKIKRNTYFLGKFIGSDYPTRLVKRGTGEWKRRVHENWETSKPVGVAKNVFITHNTATNLHDYIDKINYYSDLHALANDEEGKKSNLFKIILFPPAKFVVTLYKSRNVVFSIMQALHSFLSWSKLYFLQS